jgi:spoIIIJ-associated protein
MYDRRNEPNEFVGESVEDATASAARFFDVDAAELNVVVAPENSISGAAGRTVVVAFPKSVRPGRGGGGGDGGRERDDDRRGRGRGDRGDRDEGRSREGRGRGRGRERGDRGDRGGRGNDRGERAERSEPAGAAADVAPQESKGSAQGELGPVGEFVLGVLERMSLGGFEISEVAEDDFLVYQIRGAVTSPLSSGDGRSVDALQLLANQAAKQLLEDAPRVVIDVEGESEAREESLQRLASRAAARAIDTGRAIALDPMDARSRRIVHVALRDEDGIATMSMGTGRFRQVVVVPEGAPEYEEALEASRSASS